MIVRTFLLLMAVGCGSVEPCDIRDTDCQLDVFYAVLDARGDPWDAWADPPPIDVINEAAYRAYLEAAVGSAREEYDIWDDALTLLGIVDPNAELVTASIDSRVQNTAAFYSPSTERVTIIDHGKATTDGGDLEILAHELVHAIQDRYDGLTSIYKWVSNSDSEFAVRSIVEGEAVLYAAIVALRAKGESELDAIAWDDVLAGWRDTLNSAVATSPSRLSEALRRYVYPYGAEYQLEVYRDGGNPAVESEWHNPPLSALHVLDGGQRSQVGGITCTTPPPDGYERIAADTLGCIGAFALLADDYDESSLWWSQARTWRDDRIELFRSEDDSEHAVLWRFRWSSESRADSFERELTGRPLDWQVTKDEVEVTIAAASDPAQLTVWPTTECE